MGWKNIILFAALLLFTAACAQQAQTGQPQPTEKNVDALKNGDTSGIVTGDVVYFGNSKGFLAKPKKEGIYPAVVMIHEWWGLNDNIKEMARSLAAEGYVVLAVDLYNGKVGKNSTEAGQLAGAVRSNPAEAIQNMKAAVQYLKNLENVDDNKIASMGWCFGGAMSLQLALNEKLAATVIYYGNLETNATKLSVIKWPILGIFGSKDTSIPVETVKKFEAALNEVGIENEIHIYEGVGHAFANPSGMNYAPEQTKDAWEKTLEFLERELKKTKNETEQSEQKMLTSIPDEWKICEVDSDCVETQSGRCPCSSSGGQTAINKKYLDLWIQNLEKFGPTECLTVDKCFKATPKCVDKRCKLV
ncbi:dienelactone hydrolase family protein [Candidatus Woesearchaeota archaeon]|nr:dienelactone hydrolase family protein [Candidatus Woesearchaeota archaeon]